MSEALESWMLSQRQALPLESKIAHTINAIRRFYDAMNGDVFVSFSGGKDSTVLLDIVRSIYPDIKAVFVNTGLEYPEILNFVRTVDNVQWLRPEMNFRKVLAKYGYPVISKKVARQIRYLKHPTASNENSRNLYLTGKNMHGNDSLSYKLPEKWKFLINAPFEISEQCCSVMKERPLKRFQRENKMFSYIGTMASDSYMRRERYLRTGCNIITGSPLSKPLSIWCEHDIWNYIRSRNLSYCSIYDTGVARTGCIFCAFGVHLEKCPNRFQRLMRTHPKYYDYCMNVLNMAEVLDYIGVEYQ